jgi:hypothetical protein
MVSGMVSRSVFISSLKANLSLEGRNHIFMPTEPATERFFEEVELFLSKHQTV